MKFTDGYWHVRDGLQVLHPAEVEQVVAGERTLVVHSPTGRIRHRGDTLNRPVVTTTYSSPAPGVLRVRIDHLTGGAGAGPRVELGAGARHPGGGDVDDAPAAPRTGGPTVRGQRQGPRGGGALPRGAGGGRGRPPP